MTDAQNDSALLKDPLTTFQRLFPCHEMFTKITITLRTLFLSSTPDINVYLAIRFVAVTIVSLTIIRLRGACTIFGAQC